MSGFSSPLFILGIGRAGVPTPTGLRWRIGGAFRSAHKIYSQQRRASSMPVGMASKLQTGSRKAESSMQKAQGEPPPSEARKTLQMALRKGLTPQQSAATKSEQQTAATIEDTMVKILTS